MDPTLIWHVHVAHNPMGRGSHINIIVSLMSTIIHRCDWMQPEAWDVEHNFMHHYMLGEGRDPDLLERNSEIMQHAQIPCHTHTHTHTHTHSLSHTHTF